MAARPMPKQREIAVSEFFSKNRHLLGFDSPQKALLTAVREAVDNALDACEEARILPDLTVELTELPEGRYKVRVEDNGPGIPKEELGKIFAKLLYGSKFHRLKQSRGQQGIGISAAVMYSQMTTGEPSHITSKMPDGKAQHVRLFIDTAKNQPKLDHQSVDNSDWWAQKTSGTSIEMTMSAQMKGGRHGIEAYLKQTALANPHARMLFRTHKLSTKLAIEKGAPPSITETLELPRVVAELPKEPVEIRPHPHGIELGTLQRYLHEAGRQRVHNFLTTSFSRVTGPIATELLATAGISPEADSNKIPRDKSEALFKAIQNTRLMAPPTNCLSPIGEEALIKALFSLYGDIDNLGDEDDLEHIQLPTTKALVPIVDATPEPAAAAPPPAPLKKGKKLPGKQADQQLALFQRAAPSTPEPAAVPEPAGGDKAAAVSAGGKVKIEADEEGAQVIAIGEDTFVTAVTRPPSIYRGNPFQMECGILYSKQLPADELARVFRFANRVPLLYQASACAMFKAVTSAPWRSYEVLQARGALPTGPLVVMVHIASAWVPYTSESKEAIAHYPEVLKEMRLAVMEAGRRLQRFLRRRKRDADEQQKRDYITKYLSPIGEALRDILNLTKDETQVAMDNLKIVLEESRSAAGESKPNKKAKPSKQAEASVEQASA